MYIKEIFVKCRRSRCSATFRSVENTLEHRRLKPSPNLHAWLTEMGIQITGRCLVTKSGISQYPCISQYIPAIGKGGLRSCISVRHSLNMCGVALKTFQTTANSPEVDVNKGHGPINVTLTLRQNLGWFQFAIYLLIVMNLYGCLGASFECGAGETYQNGACAPCPSCPVGEELQRRCGYGTGGNGSCTECKPGFFRSDLRFEECFPCTNCSQINREERYQCRAIVDAECGKCLYGFYDYHRGLGIEGAHPCEHCSFDLSDPDCIEWTQTQSTSTESQPSAAPVEEGSLSTWVIAISVVLVFALPMVAAGMVWWIRHRHGIKATRRRDGSIPLEGPPHEGPPHEGPPDAPFTPLLTPPGRQNPSMNVSLEGILEDSGVRLTTSVPPLTSVTPVASLPSQNGRAEPDVRMRLDCPVALSDGGLSLDHSVESSSPQFALEEVPLHRSHHRETRSSSGACNGCGCPGADGPWVYEGNPLRNERPVSATSLSSACTLLIRQEERNTPLSAAPVVSLPTMDTLQTPPGHVLEDTDHVSDTVPFLGAYGLTDEIRPRTLASGARVQDSGDSRGGRNAQITNRISNRSTSQERNDNVDLASLQPDPVRNPTCHNDVPISVSADCNETAVKKVVPTSYRKVCRDTHGRVITLMPYRIPIQETA